MSLPPYMSTLKWVEHRQYGNQRIRFGQMSLPCTSLCFLYTFSNSLITFRFSEINESSDVIKIFLLEERKKGIQKKLGEIRLLVSQLPKNQKTEAWLPLTGEKAKTICDVRVKILLTVRLQKLVPFWSLRLTYYRLMCCCPQPSMIHSSSYDWTICCYFTC